MESSSSDSKEIELQQMQLDERELNQKCLAWFKKLKIHLEFLRNSFVSTNTRPFEIAFRVFFREEHETFREKMYHNLNQLQWQLERDSCRVHNSKTCLGHDSKTCLVGAVLEACLVIEGATLEACLVNEGITLNDNMVVTESNATKSENSSSKTPISRSEDENRSSDKEINILEGNHADADIGSSNDSIEYLNTSMD
ncbi:hypothetical protein Tco_0486635 [Tanacetum coccineum]